MSRVYVDNTFSLKLGWLPFPRLLSSTKSTSQTPCACIHVTTKQECVAQDPLRAAEAFQGDLFIHERKTEVMVPLLPIGDGEQCPLAMFSGNEATHVRLTIPGEEEEE
jgi:hypothetical protein